MNKPRRLAAMISSTALDLPNHRQGVVDACLREDVFPIGMEHLPARDTDAVRVSMEMVDRADIYIGIFAWRYGYRPEGHEISITEMEFNRAVEREIPILVFEIHKDHALTIGMVETDNVAQQRLHELKMRASNGRGRRQFKSPEELRAEVIHALSDLKQRLQESSGERVTPDFHPPNIIPNPPEPYIAHPYSLLQTKDVVGRKAEIGLLTDWVITNQQVSADTRIFNLVAIGGMGKSALTWKWFKDVVPNKLPKLAGRLWWSFYESDAHWENFIIRALAYTSGQSENNVREMKSPDREDRLWRILDQQPFLVVLDGLERILLAYARMDAARLPDEDLDERTANAISETQDLPSINKSYVEKHRLRQCADIQAGRILRRLTQLHSSRILISSRLYPAELQTDTGKPLPGCFAKYLTGLPDDDALNLWRAFGVTGTREQLLPIFHAFGNYPLILRALAGEVADFRAAPGDFDQWIAENRGFKPAELPLKNARTHVLRFALRGLGKTQRYALSTLAAFRMPATWETLSAVIAEDSNLDKTWRLARTSELAPHVSRAKLDNALAELEDRGLVGWDRSSNRYDLHPIVRIVAWDRTSKTTQTSILELLHEYFSAHTEVPVGAKVSRLEDITGDIELYCTLIALGQFKRALSVFRRSLNEPTLYVFADVRLRVELLEMLFPNGTSAAPSLPSEGITLRRWLAFAYYLLGEPGRSLQMTRRDPDLTWANMRLEDWRNEFFSALSAGKLRAAELALANNLVAPYLYKDPSAALMSCLPWFMYFFALRGVFTTSEKAEARLQTHLTEQGLPRKTILVELIKAQRFIWNRQPQKALSAIDSVSQVVFQVDRQREPIRMYRLYGAAYLALGNLGNASDHLQKALVGARTVNLVEEELRTLSLLAELHRQRKDYDTARELLEQVWGPAERGPYPTYHADALNVLSQIERDQDNHRAGIAAAEQAYVLAWCDGPPYAYHYGLTNARKHLQELVAPEPDLPQFDPSKFGPVPEVEFDLKIDPGEDPIE